MSNLSFRKKFKELLQEKDTGHNIHTPFSLCDKILKKMNTNSNQTFGIFYTLEFAITLIEDYGIHPANIWLFGDSPEKKKIANHLGINYNSINVLFDDKEINMKFDVIVGNPPYQLGKNKLYYRQFVYKAFDLMNETCSMIIPASWNSGGMTMFKKDVIDNGLKEYTYLGNQVFKGSQNDVSYFVSEKGYSGDVLVKNKKGKVLIKNLSSHGIMPHNDSQSSDILIKLSSYKGYDSLYQRGSVNPEKANSGNNKFIVRNGFENQPCEEKQIDMEHSVGYGDHKVVIAYNSSIGNIGPAKYIDPDYSIGYAVACFVFSTEAECHRFCNYLNSKLVKFIIKNLKTSIQNAKNIFEKIPVIDLSKNSSDSDLYKYFNLNQNEIDIIESNS